MDQRVNQTGVTFQGKGANESVRVYLHPAAKDGKWMSTLRSMIEGEGESVVTSELEAGRILYFRLKSTQSLTIKCTTVGRLKVL